MPPQAGMFGMQTVQLGLEGQTTPGTAVPATTLWRGMGMCPQDDDTVILLPEISGYVSKRLHPMTTKYLGGMALASRAVTYEEVGNLIYACIGGSTANTADGVSGAYYNTFTQPTTSLPFTGAGGTLQTITARGGDNYETKMMTNCVGTAFSLAGKYGGDLTMSGMLMGQRITTGTLTASITKPTTFTGIPFGNGKVYIDPESGAFGGTQVATAIRDIKVDFKYPWLPQYSMSGSLNYDFPLFTPWSVTGSLTYTHSAASSLASGAQLDKQNNALKLLRLDWTGPLSGGTLYPNYRFITDIPITYMKSNVLANDGNTSIIAMSFEGGQSDVAGTAGKFIVANKTASLF